MLAKGATSAYGDGSEFVKAPKKRGMPDLHTPSKKITAIIEGWLNEHKASGRETSEFQWATPDLEFENAILARNLNENRKLRERDLDRMVRALKRGETMRNLNNAICLNVEGNTETGQHRGVACIRAEIPSEHIVKIGPVGFATRDWSSPHSVKDVWKTQGISQKYLTTREAMTRMLLAIDEGRSIGSRESDKIEVKSRSLNGNSVFEDAIIYGVRDPRPFYSQKVLGVAYYLIAERGGREGLQFLGELFDGTTKTAHKKNINGLISERSGQLRRLNQLYKQGDKLFHRGEDLNFRALNAILMSWNAYPNVPETCVWDSSDPLIPQVRRAR